MKKHEAVIKGTLGCFLVLMLLSYVSFSYTKKVLAATHDLADTNNWNVRLDGSGWLGDQGVYFTDVNGDGDDELIIHENHANSTQGAMYIICKLQYSQWLTSGNKTFDLLDPANYNIRILNSGGTGFLGHRYTGVGDFDNDNKNDLAILSVFDSLNGLANSGSAYILKGSSLPSCSSTGQSLDLADSTKWFLRIDGPSVTSILGSSGAIFSDFNGDGLLDLSVGTAYTGYNSRANSGSVYIFSNQLLRTYSGAGNIIDLQSSNNFTVRYDGPDASTGFSDMALSSTDLDNDGKYELIIPNRQNSKVFIIKGSQISLSGTGNTVDMADTSKWYMLITGETTTAYIGISIATTDLDNDGKMDMVLGGSRTAYNGRSSAGSVYTLDNDILMSGANASGNTLSLATSTNYNIRIDGDACTSSCFNFSYIGIIAGDYDGDSLKDIAVSTSAADYNGRNNSGSLHVFYGSLLAQYAGTGNLLDVTNPAHYSIRYDGAIAGNVFSEAALLFADLNDDGRLDLLSSAYKDDYNGRTDSGSVYVMYNFPHTIALNALPSNIKSGTSTMTLSGTITATHSVTNISGVQFSVDNPNYSGTWGSCTAIDGTFDSKLESFQCEVAVSALATGKHKVRVRAYDSHNSYTMASSYEVGNFSYGVNTTTVKQAISTNSENEIAESPTPSLTESPMPSQSPEVTDIKPSVAGKDDQRESALEVIKRNLWWWLLLILLLYWIIRRLSRGRSLRP